MPINWLDKLGYLQPKTKRQSTGEFVTVAVRNHKGMSTALKSES